MHNFLQNTKVSPKLDVSLSEIFLSDFFFSKVNLGPSQKIVGLIRGVFSFGGTLGWTQHQAAPPQKKTGG